MSSLERLVLLGIRDFGGEEAFVQFNHIAHLVLGIPFTHGISEFMKHRPDWHIVLVAELALELGGGEALLRRGQQAHGNEQAPQRQMISCISVLSLFTIATLPIMKYLHKVNKFHAPWFYGDKVTIKL